MQKIAIADLTSSEQRRMEKWEAQNPPPDYGPEFRDEWQRWNDRRCGVVQGMRLADDEPSSRLLVRRPGSDYIDCGNCGQPAACIRQPDDADWEIRCDLCCDHNDGDCHELAQAETVREASHP